MELLKQATISELVRLLSRRKMIFFLLLTMVLPFIGLPIAMKLQSGLGVTGVSSDQYPTAILNLLTLFVLPLMMFMSASDSFSGEFGNRTLRSILTRPVSRMKIFSSKLLALFIMIAGHLLLGGVASQIASLFLSESDGWAKSMADTALAYSVAALPLFVLCTVAVFVAQGFRNASGALAICILLYAACKLVAFVFPDIIAYSPTSYMNWYQIWLGSSIPIGKIITIFNFLLGCGILFYTFGYYAFDKKEV